MTSKILELNETINYSSSEPIKGSEHDVESVLNLELIKKKLLKNRLLRSVNTHCRAMVLWQNFM